MKFITPSRFSELLDRLEEADSDAPDSQELAYVYRRLYEAYVTLDKKTDKKLKCWDAHNKQWLRVMTIIFDLDDNIAKIQAIVPGADPLSDGWYNIEGKDLKKCALTGSLEFNIHLLPQ